MAKATRKQALGRNLSALLRDGVEAKEKGLDKKEEI